MIALMDGDFVSLEEFIAHRGVTLNTTAQDEVVGVIDHFIQTIKE